MKKLFLAFAVLPLVIAGCGSGDKAAESTSTGSSTTGGSTPAPKEPKELLAGTWKVDMAASNIPGLTEDDKKEGESIRLTVNADNTYASKSNKDSSTGKWALDGHKVTFTADKHNQADPPPEMTLSDDGAKLTAEMKQGDQTMSVVMVKE